MAEYVTVYELIQKLAEYPADKYVEFELLATPDQLKDAEEDQKLANHEYALLAVDELDLEHDVYEEYRTVYITMHPKDA